MISEIWAIFDNLSLENRNFLVKNEFHGFHASIVDFTGLAQEQLISQARDTVKKEGPCIVCYYGNHGLLLR